MDKPIEQIDDLIIRYSKGTIDSEEMDELLYWIEKDPKNKNYFKERINLLKTLQPRKIDFNAKKSLAEFEKSASQKQPVSFSIKVAAIAASLLIAILLGKLLLDKSASDLPVFIDYAAAETNLTKVLEDDSQVVLSENSVLSVPERFSENRRMVRLDGKAFFEVSEEPDRPFVVECREIMIRVIGTSFEVETNSEANSVRVAVVNGTVLVEHNTSGIEKTLQQNDQVIFSQEGFIVEETKKQDENLLSWKTGILTFNNIQMSEVAHTLSDFYGTVITFEDERLENEFITLTINNQPLDEVQKTLEIILDATIVEADGEWIIRENR